MMNIRNTFFALMAAVTLVVAFGSISQAKTDPVPTWTVSRGGILYLVTGQRGTNYSLYAGDSATDSAGVAKAWAGVVDSGYLMPGHISVVYAKYYYPVHLTASGRFSWGTLLDSTGTVPGPGATAISTLLPTNGQLMIGRTSDHKFALAALTGTSNQVVVTNGAGTSTLSLPQSIGTASTPTFASETLSATSNQMVLGAVRTATITAPTPATSSRVYTIPDPGAAANFSMLVAGNGRQAWAVTTADSSITGQSLVGTPLQFAVGISQTWAFEALIMDSSSSSAGVKFGVDVPTGATLNAIGTGQTTGVTAINSDYVTADATAGTAVTTAAGYGWYRIFGTVTTDGTHSGSVILDFLKATSGTAIVKTGSYILAHRIS